MILSYEFVTLHLRYPFILSDSRITEKRVVVVHFQHDGLTGIGESAPSSYFGETPETVASCLNECIHLLESQNDFFDLEGLSKVLRDRFPRNASARSAVLMAVCDWAGKMKNMPVHKLLNIDSPSMPVSSMTIGIDQADILAKKIGEARDFTVLKIKLGRGDQDYEIMKTVRRHTNTLLRIDANEGWTKDEAAKKIEWLAAQNVELIEQPLAKENLSDMEWLHNRSTLPIFADENVTVFDDISSVAGCFDGINIKLDKCGGLVEALRMISRAKYLNLKTMLGCMVQSSIGISAAAQIAPLVDYADLDGHLLINDDPFHGVQISNGMIELSPEPGIGVRALK